MMPYGITRPQWFQICFVLWLLPYKFNVMDGHCGMSFNAAIYKRKTGDITTDDTKCRYPVCTRFITYPILLQNNLLQ